MAKNDLKILTCEGDLSIETSEKWFNDFKKAVKEHKDIRFNFRRIEKLDLSFIQLLVSLKNTCDKENINFEMTGDLPREVKETLTLTGVLRQEVEKKTGSTE